MSALVNSLCFKKFGEFFRLADRATGHRVRFLPKLYAEGWTVVKTTEERLNGDLVSSLLDEYDGRFFIDKEGARLSARSLLFRVTRDVREAAFHGKIK